MNKNVLIVLAGGFVIAILVAVLVQASLNANKSEPVTSDVPTVEILVAARDLAVGRKLSSMDLKWQSWPDNAVFAGAIVREEGQKVMDVADGRLSVALSAGQPLLESSIIRETKGNFMAASLQPGMRAIGISVKAHTMAGGFIGPGDYVDVIITYKVRVNARDNPELQSKINQFASETILENVRVLAIDQQSQREEDKAKVARTVTLEVDSAGAEKLSLASEMGDISLSLRSLGDKEDKSAEQVTTDVNMSRVLQDIARMQRGSGSGTGGIVRVYNGSSPVNVPVRQVIEER